MSYWGSCLPGAESLQSAKLPQTRGNKKNKINLSSKKIDINVPMRLLNTLTISNVSCLFPVQYKYDNNSYRLVNVSFWGKHTNLKE